MNHSKRHHLRGATLALAALALFVAPVLAAGPSGAVFTTRLTGKNEVPTNDSKAHGSATFRVVWGDSVGTTWSGEDSLAIERIDYVVRATNLDGLQAGHIHSGAEGVPGPVVVDLHVTANTGRSRGVVAEGSIEANDLAGPLAGMTLRDLYDLILEGEAYVNLHTTDYPGGEIRGQLSARGGSPR
jgi:hypothetical protein